MSITARRVRPIPGKEAPADASRLTLEELATWRSLLDTTAELRRILGAELQVSGLSPADYQVLLALTEADAGRLRSAELASTIDWERSRLSHHLGRMESRGLIRRDECATDSRGAEVALTERGVRMFRAAAGPHLRAVKRHFADALTPGQLDALGDVLGALRTHLRGPITDAGAGGA
jgi:DNA-binding MarR family transcriptional regulator